MKRVCYKTKDAIVNIIADEFIRVRDDLDNTPKEHSLRERNYGRYQAMMDLMYKLEIYEEE